MATSTQNSTYYTILGVSTKASKDEIRRAFARLVHQHSPEKDPEGYKRIRQAYDTLSDDDAKTQYDVLLQHGDEIGQLSIQA